MTKIQNPLKTSKTQNFQKQNPLRPREKLWGGVGFCQDVFFSKSENYFKPGFIEGQSWQFFCSGEARKKPPTPNPEKPASNYFQTSGRKS
jgi:hypothetical protein